jgi:signal peptidase I
MALAAAWWYFAPTQLGGSTRYVVTHGTSMEPRFHTGDLGIVRPADQYKVGEIVAYWSTMLHTEVLHRIIAIHGDHYVFKGDNNNFIDPIEPTRAELLGRLWLHIPHAGALLDLLHSPAVAAALCAILGCGLLFGFREQRHRRRKRPRKAPTGAGDPGILSVNARNHTMANRLNFGTPFIVAACAAAICLVVAVVAFARPADRASGVGSPYAQQVTFGYTAHVRPGPVYPTGGITTGQPIFLRLIRNLTIHVHYQLTSRAQSSIAGTEEILLHINGPSGWHRNIVLVPTTHFASNSTDTDVPLSLPQVESFLTRIASLIGPVGMGGYDIAIEPVIHVTGTVAAQPVHVTFSPLLTFNIQSGELASSGASPSVGGAPGPNAESTSAAPSYTTSEGGTVPGTGTTTNTLTALGASIPVPTLRWLAALGLVLSVLTAALAYVRRRAEPFQETAHIQSHYGHMIVPIVAGEDLGWPAVDVPTIKALAKLAESGQRLILHSRSGEVDTYMVNDEGTVYRYQVRPSKVVWGEWSDTGTPVKAAA